MSYEDDLDINYMYYVYRKINNKSKTISTLQKMKKIKNVPKIDLEIIWSYVYFHDISRANERYHHITILTDELQKTQIFLDYNLKKVNLNNVITQLKKKFDIDLFNLYNRLTSDICTCESPTQLNSLQNLAIPIKCGLCKFRNMGKLCFLKSFPDYNSLSYEDCAAINSALTFDNIERIRIMRNPFTSLFDIRKYLARNKEDYKLLEYVSARRHLDMLLYDPRTFKIMNESIQIQMDCRISQWKIVAVDIRNIRNLKRVSSKYKKYFKMIEN